MTNQLSPNDVITFWDDNGAALAGGKVETWEAGTSQTVPLATYANRSGLSDNTNPIILNTRGEATIYLKPGLVYDYVIRRADNSVVRVREGVSAENAITADSQQTLTGGKLFDFTAAASGTHVEIRRDSSPLNYATTRSSFVQQHRDTAAGSTNELIPGAVFQFRSSGDGSVNAGTELSQTIWQGAYGYMEKSGDGSGHSFTGAAELGAFGAGGYNEIGVFVGSCVNKGSNKGTATVFEGLVSDSPDSGTTSFDTRMYAVAGRIAKYNATSRRADTYVASSEGNKALDSVLWANPGGFNQWKRGIDFSTTTFTEGRAMVNPNNTSLAWKTSGGATVPVLLLSAADTTYLPMATGSAKVSISTSGFASRLEVDNDATNAVLIWVNGAIKRVEVGAADSAGTGYRALRVAN